MKTNEYIEKLNQELESDEVNPPSKNSVFDAFKKYVSNKEFLDEVVSMGILYYDYNVFNTKIIGTCFEKCLDTYIRIFHNAIQINKDETISAINSFYPLISDSFRSTTELNLINNTDFDESRTDLIARYYIKAFGDIIECALKPHVMFLDKVFSLVYKQKCISKNLGDAISYLSEKDDALNVCYKAIFKNVQLNQWRNVANHNDYRILNDNEIEIEFGSKKRTKKIITQDDLADIAKKLDTLIYSHKIAFTLIFIDNYSDINKDLFIKYHRTLQDDTISQLVETTYAYGYKLININEENNCKTLSVEAKGQSNLDRNYFENYIIKIAPFVSSDFKLQMISPSKKVIYHATLANRELKILHYNY